jgi:hypothetical protein
MHPMTTNLKNIFKRSSRDNEQYQTMETLPQDTDMVDMALFRKGVLCCFPRCLVLVLIRIPN